VIDVARIDHWAAIGSGPFHSASVFSKILFLLLVVAAAVMSKSPYPLALGYAVMLLAAASSRLPWTRMVMFSFYPAVFALLYGVSLRAGVWLYSLLLIKAVTPAFAMVMLVVSTPYPRIFSLLSTFLPEIIASGLFMTYRTLFILLGMMDSFAAAIRLRGGFSPGSLHKNSANIANGIAMLLIRAVERATRLYAVMAVRGYNGSMAETGIGRLNRHDWLPLMTGALVLMLVVVWK
jgi:energy-coupling factor transporter transmembrane protein EcfT